MQKKGKFHHKDYDFVHQANGDFRTVEIKEIASNKVFIKHYHLLSKEQVQDIYEKYVFFYERLPSEKVRTPQPLALTDTSITFVFVNLPEENRLNHFLTSDEATKIDALKRTAEALQILHEVGEEKNYNHGDFWYGNVFLFDQYVYIIDMEAPPRFQEKYKELQQIQYKEFDFALFFNLLVTLEKSALQGYLTNNTKYHDIFFQAYTEAGVSIDSNKFKSAMRFLLKDKFFSIIKCHRTVWYKVPAHVVLFCLLLCRNRYFINVYI